MQNIVCPLVGEQLFTKNQDFLTASFFTFMVSMHAN
ncbi:hypothetical protein XHV734_4359 [Xanthomonas hortorum pv. vitians]|nr:hypothetical protein XHV734_4359 [Xanthomonas hortorum pv. vitians]